MAGRQATLEEMGRVLLLSLLLCSSAAACRGEPLGLVADAGHEPEAAVPDRPAVDAGCAPEPLALDLISDFEGTVASVLAVAGRHGAWRPVTDSSSSGILVPSTNPLTPTALPDGEHCGSQQALRLLGDGHFIWGAGALADLAGVAGAAGSGPAQAYDAAARGYRGIELWAHGQGIVRLVLWDLNTLPQPGPCEGSAADPCGEPHAVTIQLTGAWRRYVFLWEDFQRQGSPGTAPDATQLVTMGVLTTKNAAFDVWIDDPAFFN